MVVKSATKKKLMDMLVPEEFAHKLADDRKWDDVKILTQQEIAQFCENLLQHNQYTTYSATLQHNWHCHVLHLPSGNQNNHI
mgnify:CR=1 FL=1